MNRFQKIWRDAKDTLREKEKVRKVADTALDKLQKLTGDNFKDATSKLKLLVRMIKAHISGSYKSFSARTVLLITFALLYFVVPTDAIPDFIPALGFTDDISILYFVWKQVNKDIVEFQLWENTIPEN